MEANGQIAKNKYWLGVAMWVVGVAITILAGYTSVTLTRGAQMQEMREIRQEILELKEQNKAIRSEFLTNREFERYVTAQKDTLDRIDRNVQDIRNRQK